MGKSERGTKDQRRWWAKTRKLTVVILTGKKSLSGCFLPTLVGATFIKTWS